MPAILDHHADDPIVCITFNDDVNVESLAHAYLDSVEAAVRQGEFVCRILDFRFAHTAYAQIYADLLDFVQNIAGAALPPTIQAVFVGQPNMAQFFAEQQVAFFTDVDSAIAHVQSLLAEPATA
jgi:hypothetical protein